MQIASRVRSGAGTSSIVPWDEQAEGQVPQSPERPEEERFRHRVLPLLQVRQGEPTPACFLAERATESKGNDIDSTEVRRKRGAGARKVATAPGPSRHSAGPEQGCPAGQRNTSGDRRAGAHSLAVSARHPASLPGPPSSAERRGWVQRRQEPSREHSS
jgi:hypothetical protein